MKSTIHEHRNKIVMDVSKKVVTLFVFIVCVIGAYGQRANALSEKELLIYYVVPEIAHDVQKIVTLNEDEYTIDAVADKESEALKQNCDLVVKPKEIEPINKCEKDGDILPTNCEKVKRKE